MKPGRIPCVNPCCKRTASAAMFDCEIICGKCFKALPSKERETHRRYWREIRKWQRRILKTVDEMKRDRMKAIRQQWSDRLNHHWETVIKASFTSEKPEGIDAFLEEMGL